MRQQKPKAGRSEDVKQALDDSPEIHFAGPPQPHYCRHKRLVHCPFGIRHVACVTQTFPPIIVKRPDAARGFCLLPRRWVVERTFAWLGRNRRLAKDFEAAIGSAEAWLYLASVPAGPRTDWPRGQTLGGMIITGGTPDDIRYLWCYPGVSIRA